MAVCAIATIKPNAHELAPRPMKDYVARNLENPNSRGNSICAIGMVVVKEGKVVDRLYSTINPEDRIDKRNAAVTGIDAARIERYPTLPEYWPKVEGYLRDLVIVSHNAKYGLAVLTRSLERYSLDVPDFRYIDTLKLCRKYMDAPSYNLGELSKSIGHQYSGRQVMGDASATQALFEYLEGKYGVDDSEIHEYRQSEEDSMDVDLVVRLNEIYGIVMGITADRNISPDEIKCIREWMGNNMDLREYPLFDRIITALDKALDDGVITAYEQKDLMNVASAIGKNKFYSDSTVAIQFLQGIIRGIAADGKISRPEGMYLKGWLEENDYLSGVYPYDKVYSAITEALKDNMISSAEQEAILHEFKEILNPDSNEFDEIELKGKTFCLAGDFEYGSDPEVRKVLESKGAISKMRVSNDLDYLFVGNLGVNRFRFGGGGGKIAMAEEMREKGKKIRIISEEELFKQI